jgi:hypothetical protein
MAPADRGCWSHPYLTHEPTSSKPQMAHLLWLICSLFIHLYAVFYTLTNGFREIIGWIFRLRKGHESFD